MKKGRMISNFIYSGSYQIFKIIIPLVLTPYISRVLGPEGNGIYSYISSVVAYFVLIGNLGMETYGQIEISKVKKDSTKIRKVFWEIFELRLLFFGIIAISYFVFVGNMNKDKNIYFLMSLVIFTNMLNTDYLYQALEDFRSIAIRNYLVKIIGIVLVFLLVREQTHLWIYVIIINMAELIGKVIMLVKIYPLVKIPMFTKFANMVSHIKGGIIYFIPAVASTVMVYIDKVMLGSILRNDYQNGIYAQPEKLYQLLLSIISSLILVVRPGMVYEWKNKNIGQVTEKIKLVIKVCIAIIIPISFGLFIISDYFVIWFFGKGYEASVIILKIFCIISVIRAFSLLLFEILLVQNRMKMYDIVLFFGMILNLIGNSVMIKKYEAMGAVYATLVSEIGMLILLLILNRKMISLVKLVKYTYKYVMAGLVMTIVCLVYKGYVEINNFVNMILLIAVGGVTYLVMLLIFKEEMLMSLCKKNKAKEKKQNEEF